MSYHLQSIARACTSSQTMTQEEFIQAFESVINSRTTSCLGLFDKPDNPKGINHCALVRRKKFIVEITEFSFF